MRLVRSEDELVEIDLAGRTIVLEVPFTQAHLRRNLLPAVAAAAAVGVVPEGRVALELSPGRGQRVELLEGVILIDDCYNANPMSMRAALEDLAQTAAAAEHARTVAVLGDMLELGPRGRDYHVELGEEVVAGRGRSARDGRAARRGDRRAVRRRALLRPGRGGRRRDRPRAAAPRRRRARQGLAGGRAGTGLSGAQRPGCACNGLDFRACSDRGHRVAAAVPVPEPEVHRVPAPARVRAEHPRGGARGTQDQGGHADDGRDHHHDRVRGPVPDPVDAGLAVDRGARRRARVRAARVRRRLHEDRQAPLARPARADQARGHDRDLARPVVGRDPEGRRVTSRSACGSSTPASIWARCTRC